MRHFAFMYSALSSLASTAHRLTCRGFRALYRLDRRGSTGQTSIVLLMAASCGTMALVDANVEVYLLSGSARKALMYGRSRDAFRHGGGGVTVAARRAPPKRERSLAIVSLRRGIMSREHGINSSGEARNASHENVVARIFLCHCARARVLSFRQRHRKWRLVVLKASKRFILAALAAAGRAFSRAAAACGSCLRR